MGAITRGLHVIHESANPSVSFVWLTRSKWSQDSSSKLSQLNINSIHHVMHIIGHVIKAVTNMSRTKYSEQKLAENT